MQKNGVKQGAVSLFMVIFSMLIITVITVGFLRLVVADQRQATDNDLSQSAYDSALTGVEDAKRALLSCYRGASGCDKSSIADETCNAAIVRYTGVQAETDAAGTLGEVPIQRSSGSENDRQLDQAYTCVTIQPDTYDYLASLSVDESKLIPLKGTAPWDSVRVSWFLSGKDVKSPDGAIDVLSPTEVAKGYKGFPKQVQWPDNRPSVLRTQFMQVGKDFNLSQFDAEVDGKSNANTVFMYPAASGVTTTSIADRDSRRDISDEERLPADPSNAPLGVQCQSVAAGGYACSVRLAVPRAVGTDETGAAAFLRLTALYVGTSFRVELMNGDVPVKFDGVQPKVDSTGRANDLFRRVEARVDLQANAFPLPQAAVDVSGNFCKNFTVTPDKYSPSDSCKP